MSEKWLPIQGCERYHISNKGRIKSFVRSKEGRILKPQNCHGYLRIKIGGKAYFIHRLVAHAFCKNYEEGLEVNHINEIKHDNRAENLEWVTRRVNLLHGTRGERAAQRVRNAILLWDSEGNLIKEYPCASAAAKDLGVHLDTVYRNINGRTKPKEGYILTKKKERIRNELSNCSDIKISESANIKIAA